MLTAVINYWAVLVAAVASFLIGGLWYSPVLFGKQWMALTGRTGMNQNMMGKESMRAMGIGFIVGLVTSYVLAHFVDYVAAIDIAGGVTLAFWIWLGFVATVFVNTIIYEGKSVKLFVINAGYQLVSLGVMGAILAVWG